MAAVLVLSAPLAADQGDGLAGQQGAAGFAIDDLSRRDCDHHSRRADADGSGRGRQRFRCQRDDSTLAADDPVEDYCAVTLRNQVSC
jgi:hypothetical protein